MSYESQKRQEIMEAYLFLREKNQSIPSDTLELMKDAALESLVNKNESISPVSVSSPLDKLHDWCGNEGYKVGVELLVKADNMKPIIVDCNSRTSVSEFKEYIDEC